MNHLHSLTCLPSDSMHAPQVPVVVNTCNHLLKLFPPPPRRPPQRWRSEQTCLTISQIPEAVPYRHSFPRQEHQAIFQQLCLCLYIVGSPPQVRLGLEHRAESLDMGLSFDSVGKTRPIRLVLRENRAFHCSWAWRKLLVSVRCDGCAAGIGRKAFGER